MIPLFNLSICWLFDSILTRTCRSELSAKGWTSPFTTTAELNPFWPVWRARNVAADVHCRPTLTKSWRFAIHSFIHSFIPLAIVFICLFSIWTGGSSWWISAGRSRSCRVRWNGRRTAYRNRLKKRNERISSRWIGWKLGEVKCVFFV